MPDVFILIFAAALTLAGGTLIQRWLTANRWLISNEDYLCSNCGGYIYIPPANAMLALHLLGRKWVRCPHCGEMAWAVPIRK